jgi:hypothetical protein
MNFIVFKKIALDNIISFLLFTVDYIVLYTHLYFYRYTIYTIYILYMVYMVYMVYL